MEIFKTRNGVSVRAYQGDAITLLAFDVKPVLTTGLAGFTISYKCKQTGTADQFLYNRLTFSQDFMLKNAIPQNDKNSTLYSPIQKFNWVHIPNTDVATRKAIFGDYIYTVTPRYIINGIFQPINEDLSVTLEIPVKPYIEKNAIIAFTRGFVSSVAYATRFSRTNNSVRPKINDSLTFDIKQTAGSAKRWNSTKHRYEMVPYSFEEQHEWLGWQARSRVVEFLDEIINDKKLSLKVLAFDLDEPEICKRLLHLAQQNRLMMILDDSKSHTESKAWETVFESEFLKSGHAEMLKRGHFSALAHCKIMIQMKGATPKKVLTGSANFSTNGLYVNSNHIIIFKNLKIGKLYSDLFDTSFGPENMKNFKGSTCSADDHNVLKTVTSPKMTVTFAPHKKEDAERIFSRISAVLEKDDTTDILFAVMNDRSAGSILASLRKQIANENVFSYGITDTIGKNDADFGIFLYKPNSKKGIRVAAHGIENNLPEPFGSVPGVDGYAIHHKFIVVNFKGKNPVVYCGSSNLAFGPEQKNGDNLLEISDKDVVTAFAIEALRLVDHFHWRNTGLKSTEPLALDELRGNKKWSDSWLREGDLKCRQRQLYIRK
ncbi:phospholipase D-like domain-containing protein [Kaistella palustris]|uniref:phospholipase D-like domain-containing protein n=1 Tax=Kaistella palustris TaxID=493376 RepID=UPI0004113EE9|nr:phospholipase D-like domain-containing protein [Kaistella palustris]